MGVRVWWGRMDELTVLVAAYIATPFAWGLSTRSAKWPRAWLYLGNAMTTIPFVTYYAFEPLRLFALPCFVAGFGVLAYAVGRALRHAAARRAEA